LNSLPDYILQLQITETAGKRMTRRNAVRSLASLLLLGAASSAVMAQNFEYTTSQGNLSQVRVTSALHANLQAYVANFPAAQDLRIAILDGLADVSHSDLAGRIEAHLAYDGSYGWADDHGTHVAGIAGASRNGSGIVGIAPTAKLLSIPVFDDYGWVAWDGGRAAFDRAQSLGAKVVNMSYGSTLRGQTFLPGELDIIDDYRNSMVMVRAAGNQGATLSRIAYSGDASTDLAHLLIVGSVNSRGSISSFSNRPGESCIANSTRCAADDKIKNFFIVAPGERVLSDLPLNA
jgi:subtilisin family serine protease